MYNHSICREDVIIYKEREKQNKIAVATYLGPKDGNNKDGNCYDQHFLFIPIYKLAGCMSD